MSPDAVPALPRGVRLHRCAVRGADFLLAPEKAIELDEIGVAILSRVDGATPLGALIDDLAAAYAAPREVIAEDVTAFLVDLATRRHLALT